jgi:hypothetical protein
MTSPIASYEAALAQALSEEASTRDLLEKLRAKVILLDADIAKLSDAVDALMPLIPADRRAPFAEKLAAMRPPAKLNRGTTAYEAIVELLDRSVAREWSAPEVQDALISAGTPIQAEQVHNVLSYLMRRKRLSRTGRGKYVLIRPLPGLEGAPDTERRTAGAAVEATPAA